MNITINTNVHSRFSSKSLTFIIFVLIMPLVKPDYFRRISILDLFFDLWSAISACCIIIIALFRYIEKKWSPSRCFILILILNIWLQFSTIFNSGFSVLQFKSFISIITMSLIVDIFVLNYKELISALMINFEILVYSNFITFLIFPHGMYSDGNYSTNWLLGYDNSHIKFFMCAIIISVMYKSVSNNKRRSDMLIFMVILSVVFTKVFTALMGLAIIVAVLIFNYREKLKFLCKPKFYLPLTLLVFISVVVNNSLLDKMNLITAVTGKSITLTTRFDIWQDTIVMFLKSPLIGLGWNPVEIRIVEYNNPFATHAHDTYLEFLYQGGIIALLIYSLILVTVSYKLFKCTNIHLKRFCSAVFIAFLMMGIFEAYIFPVVFMMLMLLYHCEKFRVLPLEFGILIKYVLGEKK